MIIKEINIDGFGKFKDFTLKSLDQGVNIIYGDNEAGKTTLLKFIRFTLFGYPRRKNKRMKPTQGGDHGGRIKGLMKSGKQVIFERFSGSKGGDINLIYNDNQTSDQEKWFELLGEADQKLYENVYTFSLDELVGIESLTESGVEDKIFSIGLGLGDTSIGDIENNIRQRVEEIYNPQGSTQQVYQFLEKITNQKDKVHDIKSNLDSYQSLTKKKESLTNEIEEIKHELHKLKKEKNKKEGVLNSYDSFLKIKNIDEELNNLPEKKELPDISKEEFVNLVDEQKRLSSKLDQLKTGTEEQEGLEDLKEKKSSVKFNSELIQHTTEVEYIRQNLEKYKQTKQNYEQSENEIENISQRIGIKLNQISSGWSEGDIEDFSDIIHHKDKIKELKNRIEEVRNEKKEIEAGIKSYKQQSGHNYKKISLTVGIIFVIAAISSFYYSAFFIMGAFIVAAAAIIVSGYLFEQNPKSEYTQRLKQLKQKKGDLKQDYTSYINNLGLNEELSPESALEALSEIGDLKQLVKQKKQIKQKQEGEREPFLDNFEQKVDTLGKNLDRDNKDQNFYITAKEILEEFKQSKEKKQQHDNYKQRFDEYKQKRERIKNKLNKTKEKIDQVLSSVVPETKDELIELFDQYQTRGELEEKRAQAVSTIEKIVGFDRAEEVINFLSQNDKQELQADVSQIKKDIEEKEEKIEQKTSRLGEIKNELERLAGESELAESMTELESYKEQLRRARSEWLSGKMSLKVLSKIKNIYEKERQPEMIKKASKYFKKITNGNYERISVSLEEEKVRVFDSNGSGKTISELSRGTKEQLLTTLRLGFIEEYEKETQPLPTVMDEVFVNFDQKRAQETAEIVEEFARDRQVLIFTCHPYTIDLFKDRVNTIEI
ncbi:MAG: AAA family ATPase [Candidatus Paceibacteria bacterium]